jgi:hypothetical protein
MTEPLISFEELKTWLGVTGTQNDALISSICSNVSDKAQQDTGRTFAVTSNTTYTYSSDGQASMIIHDRPFDDDTREVTLSGVALVEGESVWFLPDRRNPAVSARIQLQPFDTTESRWYLHQSQWFDKNLDNPRYALGRPNDLIITGVVGHPAITGDIRLALLEAGGFYYHRQKGGASGYAATMTNEEYDLSLMPQAYQDFVKNWKIKTAVAVVG